MTTPWIRTYSGLRFHPLDPRPVAICREAGIGKRDGHMTASYRFEQRMTAIDGKSVPKKPCGDCGLPRDIKDTGNAVMPTTRI